MERDLVGERVLVNPPWEHIEQIAQNFKKYRRTISTSTMGPCLSYLSEQSSTHSLDNGSCMSNFLQESNCLLDSQRTMRPSKRSSHMLHIRLWTLIANFRIRLRFLLIIPCRHLRGDEPTESMATLRHFPPGRFCLANGHHKSSPVYSIRVDRQNSQWLTATFRFSRLRCDDRLRVRGLGTTLSASNTQVQGQDTSSPSQRTTCDVINRLRCFFRADSTRVSRV
jgi:hypothetical protein